MLAYHQMVMNKGSAGVDGMHSYHCFILLINSLAIFELSSRMMLSSALPKLNRLMLPYQTTFWSIIANF
jgi:hypothetical protein